MTTPGEAARRAREGVHRGGRAGYRAAEHVTTRRRYSARHLLTAELIAGVGIVALRAVADYEPQQDGTVKGKIGHPSGQYGPLPILAGLILAFFLLSFLAAAGGTRAKVAVVAGGLLVVVLAMKSNAEFVTVAHTFSTFGTARRPPGNWQTSGTAAGSPVTAAGGAGSGGAAPKVPINGAPNPHGRNCPPGYGYYKGQCLPLAKDIQPPVE